MKIVLLTIWRVKNYGAELQAYATIKALKELGCTVKIIDYRLNELSFPTFKQRIIGLLNSLTLDTYKFNVFWEKYFPATKHYHSLKDLQKESPQADVYLVGSDQVWNPEITKDKISTYFLNFGNDSVRRISYASSFGISVWNMDSKFTVTIQNLLNRFETLSSREKSGVSILKDTFHLEATHVLDPTLLYDDYTELIGKVIPQNTLVYYPLSPFPELESFSMNLAKDLNLYYRNINKKSYLVRKIVWNRLSIGKWIKSIAESSFVVTPSFHGLAFSLIYKRQFAIVQNIKDKNRSSRITDLLNALGLSDRYFTSVEELSNSRVWEKHINYQDVSKRISSLREQSWLFLKSVLK